jgi:hypothetical protein
MVPSDDEISRGLAEIRRRRRIAFALFLGSLPAVAIFGRLTQSNLCTNGFGLVWLGLFAVAIIRVGLARCPRCGGFFHWDRWLFASNAFGRKCMRCGLPLRRSA